MSDNKHLYIDLGFRHEEIIELLMKIRDGRVLTPDQYNQLINKIGLNNISTFDGNYNSLKNKPNFEQEIKRYTEGKFVEHSYISNDLFPAIELYIGSTVDSLTDQKADKNHMHDDLYYTKSQIEDKLRQIDIGDINLEDYVTLTKFLEELAKKANLDDVYKKDEVDNLLANAGDKNHNHENYLTKEEAENTYSKMEDTDDILENIYGLEDSIAKSKVEMQNNLNSAIQDVEAHVANSLSEFNILLNGKADEKHTHDNVYTKSEVDDKLAKISTGGTIDLEGYAKKEDLVELENAIQEKADKDHNHNLSIEDIAGLQEALDNKSNKDDVVDTPVVDVPENLMELLNEKADKVHSHEEYADKEHTHDGFANKDHMHAVSDIDGLQSEFDKKANVEDMLTREEIVEIIKDNTDTSIDADHTHEEYALVDHNHDNDYAEKEHKHGINEIENLESKLNEKVDSNMVYTKEQVDKKIIDMSTGGTVDLEGYIKQSDLIQGLATKADVAHSHSIANISGLQEALDAKADDGDLVDKSELEEAMAGKADSGHVHDNYSTIEHTHDEFYTKEGTNALIQEIFEDNTAELLGRANVYTDAAISELQKDSPSDMNNFAEIANAIQNDRAELIEFKSELEETLAGKSDSEHIHTEYATIEEENQRDIFTTTELTVNTVGGIQAGSNLNGLTVKEILSKLLFPYVAPTISISGTPNGGVFEKGDHQVITSARVVVTKKSEKITKIEVLQGSTVLASQEDDKIENGGTFTYSVNVPVNSVNVQLTGKVTDATGAVRQSTTSAFTFVYPYYVGVCNDSDTVDEALVKGLTKRIESKGTKNISYTTNNQRMILAYPKSYGSIKKILDPNSFDVTSTFTQMEMKITGLDGSAQTYYVYINSASSVEDFTMTFNY